MSFKFILIYIIILLSFILIHKKSSNKYILSITRFIIKMLILLFLIFLFGILSGKLSNKFGDLFLDNTAGGIDGSQIATTFSLYIFLPIGIFLAFFLSAKLEGFILDGKNPDVYRRNK